MKEKVLRSLTRLFAPELAANMERGGSGGITEFGANEVDQFMEVDDRGADVTIFSFAGLAALYAGLPSFEFKKLLRSGGKDYNLVFFRDIRRLCYHVTPTGEPEGLDFYETAIRDVMKQLGSKHNVAMGVSVGGSAALYFGAKCGMQQVIGFSPGYPLTVYCGGLNQLKTFFDIPRLVLRPKAYAELALVTLATGWSYRQLCKMKGKKNLWPVLETFTTASPRPKATIFYGQHCRPDARQATFFDGLENVKKVPVPTVYHNCAGFLKQRGDLANTIHNEIVNYRS